jgi:hypothetical protein
MFVFSIDCYSTIQILTKESGDVHGGGVMNYKEIIFIFKIATYTFSQST